MSEKSAKILLAPPNADLDALSSLYGLSLLEKDAKLFYTSFSPKAKKLFEDIKDRFNILKSLEGLENIHIFTVDYSSIDFVFGLLKKEKIKKITLFDHHIRHIEKEPLVEAYIDETLGACTTLIIEYIIKKQIPISKEDASILLCGIYDDTNYFSIKDISPRDFEAASYLIKKGADIEFVNKYVKSYISLKDLIHVEEYLKSLEILNINGKKIGFIVLDTTQESIIDNLKDLKELEDLDAYFIIMSSSINTYVVARSKTIDVESILSKLGGGGHTLASGLKLNFVSSKKLKSIILELLKEENPKITLKDIMTKHPLTLKKDMSVEEAFYTLSNFKISKAPVLDENEHVMGAITKKVSAKALDISKKSKVQELLVSIPLLKEDDFIWEAEKVFLENPLVPMIGVLDKEGKLVGIITKSDLIRHITGDEEQKISTKRINTPSYMMDIIMDIKSVIPKGEKLYLVGGVVRDIILNRPSYDIDFVFEGDIDLLEQSLKSHGIKTHRFLGFNSVHFKYKGFKIEISSTRREYYEMAGAYPVVSKASLKEDLFRRDFTINTLLLSLDEEDFGTVIDYFGALNDIKNKIIRVLHPLSFIEDPVRILRAIRFEAKLNFKLSKDTKRLLEETLQKGMLKYAPKGRIFNELKIALQEKEFENIFETYKKYGIIESLFEYKPDYIYIEEKSKNLKMFSDWYLLEYKTPFKEASWIFFWLLVKNAPSLEEILKGISAPAFVYKFVEINIKHIISEILKAKKPSELYIILKPFSLEELALFATEGNVDVMNRIVKYLSHLKNLKPNIDISSIPPADRSKVIEESKLIEMDKIYSL
ncbi:Polynucleotide adenylyltransferase region [Hydrogenobaculum sp. Y04AAS1]|uniref:CBS domain-containing protein n=1 Tax=Hydrogenobaculum sp. (strain Y04AAS1) TaxID=380749 RepID=UPI00015BD2D0|nr:Polynucleotide adenylyltransferase region [Hydrogenobaculum sp. Y04AAS1]HCT66967.1 CBS domain-containing protein [Hydrogenobaculum sp.]